MSDNLTSKNKEYSDFNQNIEESDYKNLINRLQKIRSTIALLEKTIFK